MPYKGETLTNMLSILTLKPMFCFPTDGKATQQFESVNCLATNSENVGFTAFWLSLLPVIMQNLGRNRENGLFSSSRASSSDFFIESAQAKYSTNMMRARASSSNRVWFSPIVMTREI